MCIVTTRLDLYITINQETRRSEGIGARAIPGSRDNITSSETRRELAWSAPPALTRHSFGPSILTIVADKMPVAWVGRTPGVVRARTRTASPISNRWPGEDGEGRVCKGIAEGAAGGAMGSGEVGAGLATARSASVEASATAFAWGDSTRAPAR